MLDKDGMAGRERCARCEQHPPIMVQGRWIDYCFDCWADWVEADAVGRRGIVPVGSDPRSAGPRTYRPGRERSGS